MASKMNASDFDPIPTGTLHAWKVRPSRDPSFRGQVWRRIAARRREATWPGYLRAHAPLAAAAVAVAVALVAGAWIGHEQARERAQAQREAMITAYVQSLDARAMLAQR